MAKQQPKEVNLGCSCSQVVPAGYHIEAILPSLSLLVYLGLQADHFKRPNQQV